MREQWQLDFEWLRVQHLVKDLMKRDKLPDLQAMLFMIGMQELGLLQRGFSKEEKQDLMHIAVCKLLSTEGYFRFKGHDQDGWPHYEQLRSLKKQSVSDQEALLKEKVVQYFDAMDL